MDTSSKVRISLPKSFSGEGETIEVSLALKVWFESLTSWAKSHRCHPLLRGDGEDYDDKYPFVVADRKPDSSYLDEEYEESPAVPEVLFQAAVAAVKEVKDAGTGEITTHAVKFTPEVKAAKAVDAVLKYVFTDDERRKGHAKNRKELADYEHKAEVLLEAYEVKKIQLAESLFACLQSSTEGKAAKIVASFVDSEVFCRCPLVLEALSARFNIRSIRELPALEARFNQPMPANMDPEVFIRDKLRLREMMAVLEGDGLVPMITSDAHLIVKICNWVPSHYASVIDQIQNLILARGITSEERSDSGDADTASLCSIGTSGTYSGEHTVTVTLVTKLLREKFVELVRKNVFRPASEAAVRAYLTTGQRIAVREERTCHHCGRVGHIANSCHIKQREDKEAATAKAAAAAIAGGAEEHDPIAAYFAPNFSGNCRLCGDGAKHGFDSCPIVLAGREACGKTKPPIKALPKKVGGMNGMIGSIVVCNARSASTGPAHPNHLFMDDNGAGSNIVRDVSILRGVRPLNATCIGVGTARVTHVGSFLGEGVCLDGTTQPVRLKTVYVLEGIDRNIFGTAAFQRQPGVIFDRSGTAPYCTAGGASYKLTEDGSEPFLWFEFHATKGDLTDEDKAWLEAATFENATIGVEDDPSYGDDVNGLIEDVLLASSIHEASIGEVYHLSDSSAIYGMKAAPQPWNGEADFFLE
jgi:hypothetical protein